MKKGENIRQRIDGRFEARYEKGRDENGKIIYAYVYGKTYEEAKEKRDIEMVSNPNIKQLNLLILGSGDHGKEVYEIASSLNIFNDIKFLDDNDKSINVIGKWEDYKKYKNRFPVAIVAVGNDELRKEWMQKLIREGFIIPTLIHKSATISMGTKIGTGTVVCAGSTIGINSKIGIGCIIDSGAIIERNAIIPDYKWIDCGRIIRTGEIIL